MSLLELLTRILKLSVNDRREMDIALAEIQKDRKLTALQEEIEKAVKNSPRIALIGKTGVGKSSSVNALFSPPKPFKVGHVRATTRKPREQIIRLGESRGKLIVVDFPGLGESIRSDEATLQTYREYLAKCDVALWIVKADDRAYSDDQRFITQVLTPKLRDRLVVGINQVDLIQPGRWSDGFNVPSKEQEASMQVKVRDVKAKLKEIGLASRSIVTYSALKHYRLMHLFSAMLEACPRDRAWVLDEHKQIAQYVVPNLSRPQ